MPACPTSIDDLRERVRVATLLDEETALRDLLEAAGIDQGLRRSIADRAATLVGHIRAESDPSLMEVFLAEYGLSTDEGVALMCLAEALLRVPDDETIDALIDDKITPSSWGEHLGRSSSSLVNASTWALMLTGSILDDDDASGLVGALRSAIRRLGEPVIRTAVERAMRELGGQFVLGRDIEEALSRAAEQESLGYTHSYDMLGEAARTKADARRYHLAYAQAIGKLADHCEHADIRANPGLSVKLSALHPRFEYAQRDRVMAELLPRAQSLALLARSAGMGFNIDAEEADRLDLSLDVIEAMIADPAMQGWDGFGVVVQAYGQRATHVIDWLHAQAERLDRRLMVRLVKGAYWDSEIKRAQTLGLSGFPVFTRKPSTDVSYICSAKKLLGMTDRIYPQFATHNAHTVAAILEMSERNDAFEFQRLHGMGEALHDKVLRQNETRCRIYAPVGAHRDLLAYLVRRLLENGANSSFVNQIVDESVSPEVVAADPFRSVLAHLSDAPHPKIITPSDLFQPLRKNAIGFDLSDPIVVAGIEDERGQFAEARWRAAPMIDGKVAGGERWVIANPANPNDIVGEVIEAAPQDIEIALAAARPWSKQPAREVAAILNRAADLFEKHAVELFALAAREAGKTLPDCVAELREAVDFLRYYASSANDLEDRPAWGIIACISPWNFPLAIFTGQIAAALAAGNGVIAKPAETTSLMAARAVAMLHEAGVPKAALQLLPGQGTLVGAALTADPHIDGVCFTGSIATATHINRSMAENLAADAPLIAETGGLNAMIVDSTALHEQAVRDILTSAFQSAGQRCSALRVLYLQADVAEEIKIMLFGAMDELHMGDPWNLSTDIGPVIDEAAKTKIAGYIEAAKAEGRLLKQLPAPTAGSFIGPVVIKLGGIEDLHEEIFGPVLHIATFEAGDLGDVVEAVNASGFGLTFGLHTRIDDRVQTIVDALRVGNIYVNRNQIGAIVGSQPFGGEGLSGTGPKAGGPHYAQRFKRNPSPETPEAEHGADEPNLISMGTLTSAIATRRKAAGKDGEKQIAPPLDLPGPTGESNRLTLHPRGLILCLGPTADEAAKQARLAEQAGCCALAIAPGVDDGLSGRIDIDDLGQIEDLAGVVLWAQGALAKKARLALAARSGAIIPLITQADVAEHCRIERHLCIDTTAAGGNASLLSKVAE
ncbi:MAG: bifunctional proline dehydrogenase/L-glutamate gamma-semialdehyde dehydrogenase PutA [Geminicoccaceae bacterium]